MLSRQQWEYRVVDLSATWTPFSGKKAHNPEEKLNELGADGWELVDTLSEGGGNTGALVFKRPIR